MADPNQKLGLSRFWNQHLLVGLLIGAGVFCGGYGLLWANESIDKISGANVLIPSEPTTNTIEKITEQLIITQSVFLQGKLLISPHIISTFVVILFAVWGVGFSVLNGNSNDSKQEIKGEIKDMKTEFNVKMENIQTELKNYHNELSKKIDNLLKNQSSVIITKS